MAKPELALEKKIIELLEYHGFATIRIDAGNPYMAARGMRMRSKTTPGTSDILACAPDGRFWAIEVKAPGRRSTLSDIQREFLIKVISKGGVGLVIDDMSVLSVALDYNMNEESDQLVKDYCINSLPLKRNKKSPC